MKDYLALIGAIIILASGIPYITDMLRHKTRPNIVSWFTWSLLIGISAFAALAANQTKTAIITFGDVAQVVIVLLLGFKFGYAKISSFDVVCQLFAICGLLLWLIFNSPTIAIVSAVLIDFIASLPTFRHSWIAPDEETWQTFLISSIGAIVGLCSLSMFSIDSLTYPLYLTLLGLALSAVIIVRRKVKNIPLLR